MRTWRTRPGEPIRLQPGNVLAGKGRHRGRAQFLYRHDEEQLYWRVTELPNGGYTVEEWSREELEGMGFDLSCFQGCDDE